MDEILHQRFGATNDEAVEIGGEDVEDNEDGNSGEREEGDVVGGVEITVITGEKVGESVLILAEPMNKLLGIK